MHIAIFVNRHNVFAEHHLPHTPQAVHDFESLIWVLFPDTDENQIVKNALRRQRHVHDFREIHFEYWQEYLHTGVTDIIIFHRRYTHDRCWINRVAAMRNRGQMENWVIFDRGVKAGVIAKWAFRAHLTRLDITFQNKIDIRRDIDINRFAANELD